MKRFLVSLGAAVILGVPALASAQANATLTVSASVAAVCTVAAAPTLAFGAYDPLSATALTGSGNISVTCTKDTASALIELDNGSNFTTTRRMTNGSDFLDYDLFKPNASGAGATCSGSAWGTGAINGYSPVAGDFTSSTVAVDFKVCGSVPALQNVGVGNYNDTVDVTVTF